MDDKKREGLEKAVETLMDNLIPDSMLAGLEEDFIKDLKRHGVGYNLNTLIGFREGLNFSFSCESENPTDKAKHMTIAYSMASKLIAKKKAFAKKEPK